MIPRRAGPHETLADARRCEGRQSGRTFGARQAYRCSNPRPRGSWSFHGPNVG